MTRLHSRRDPQHNGANTTTGSYTKCGTTSHSSGPSPTGVQATHGASPDNRLHRADSLACSHTGPRRIARLCRQQAAQNGLTHLQPRWIACLSRQQVAQGGLTHLQPHRIPAQLRTTSCPGLTHLPAAPSDHSAHLHRLTTQAPKHQ